MKVMVWQREIRNKYYHLLAILIGTFLAASCIMDAQTRYPVLLCIFVVGILFSLRILEIRKTIFFPLFFLGISALVLDFYLRSNLTTLSLQWFREFPVVLYAVFLFVVIILLATKIFSTSRVTSDTIAGGISIYFLLGFLWAAFYYAVYLADPHAFKSSMPFTEFTPLHFSFETLSTIGYGDITPANKLAMTLSNLEAITGQMYIATFISRLVGLQTTRTIEETSR